LSSKATIDTSSNHARGVPGRPTHVAARSLLLAAAAEELRVQADFRRAAPVMARRQVERDVERWRAIIISPDGLG
jgi:hypothetical protein